MREKGGLVGMNDAFMAGHHAAVIAATTRNKVPTIQATPAFARDGGLMSYWPSFSEMFRGAAGYVARILKGNKPADLPVQLPTRYELAINLKTAKALGLAVPQTLLVIRRRGDRIKSAGPESCGAHACNSSLGRCSRNLSSGAPE